TCPREPAVPTRRAGPRRAASAGPAWPARLRAHRGARGAAGPGAERGALWRWPRCSRAQPGGGSGSLRRRPAQGGVLRARLWGPARDAKGPTAAILKPGKEAIVSFNSQYQTFPASLTIKTILPVHCKNFSYYLTFYNFQLIFYS